MSATKWWHLLLAAVCAVQLVSHVGRHNGFLESSRPLYNGLDYLPAEGYLTWIENVPVLYDSQSFIAASSLLLGGHGPKATGIYDRRAAYAYLASLFIPWAGPYWGFAVLNGLIWWAAAAATFWFVHRRWRDRPLAYVASFLVAIGNGFVFMAGLPMSYVMAYAAVVLLLALGEALGAFEGKSKLTTWLLLGWGAGVASIIYFTHMVMIVFWWLYGLRRVPWWHLGVATVTAIAISLSWEVYGTRVVGMEFGSDNSNVLTDAVRKWLGLSINPWPELVVLARTTLMADTLLGAFPAPWWILASIGMVVSSGRDREWAIAVVMGGLASSLAISSLFALPRIAYYMYPAVILFAARGLLFVARTVGTAIGQFPHVHQFQKAATISIVMSALAGLALMSNLDVFGNQNYNARFHYATPLDR